MRKSEFCMSQNYLGCCHSVATVPDVFATRISTWRGPPASVFCPTEIESYSTVLYTVCERAHGVYGCGSPVLILPKGYRKLYSTRTTNVCVGSGSRKGYIGGGLCYEQRLLSNAHHPCNINVDSAISHAFNSTRCLRHIPG